MFKSVFLSIVGLLISVSSFSQAFAYDITLTSQDKSYQVEIKSNADTIFLSEEEKQDIPAFFANGVAFIGKQSFFNSASKAKDIEIISEYSMNGISYTAIRLDDQVAFLIDDELASVSTNSEPWNGPRCTGAILSGAVLGGLTTSSTGPLGAAIGAIAGGVAGWANSSSCERP